MPPPTGDPIVRGRARGGVPGRWPAAGLHNLRTLLGDGDATVVEVAAWACGEVDRPDAATVRPVRSPPAIAMRTSVKAAVAALGAIGDEVGLPAILAATTDKPAVRRRAVLALAPFEGSEVDAALQRALTDRDWQVRQAAEDLLAEAGVVR